MKRDLKPVITLLQGDKRSQRLRQIFQDSPIYALPLTALMTEIENTHKARKSRFLDSNSPKFLESIVDAVIRDNAARSRLVEISMNCAKAESTLTQAVIPLKEYLLLTYQSEISFVRTKEERTQVINMALATFNKFINNVSVVKEAARAVIDDIDHSHWNMKLIVQALQSDNKKEVNI